MIFLKKRIEITFRAFTESRDWILRLLKADLIKAELIKAIHLLQHHSQCETLKQVKCIRAFVLLQLLCRSRFAVQCFCRLSNFENVFFETKAFRTIHTYRDIVLFFLSFEGLSRLHHFRTHFECKKRQENKNVTMRARVKETARKTTSHSWGRIAINKMTDTLISTISTILIHHCHRLCLTHTLSSRFSVPLHSFDHKAMKHKFKFFFVCSLTIWRKEGFIEFSVYHFVQPFYLEPYSSADRKKRNEYH